MICDAALRSNKHRVVLKVETQTRPVVGLVLLRSRKY